MAIDELRFSRTSAAAVLLVLVLVMLPQPA
jgi:hypothetical protein